MSRVGLLAVLIGLAGCFELDASDKTTCASQGDCVDGYACLSHTCVSVADPAAPWHEMTTPLDTITNVTGSGPDDVWAGVSDGDMLHWDGDDWSVQPFCPECSDDAFLWQSGPDDLWAVDSAGGVAHRDGSGWTMRSPDAPPGPISAITGVPGRPELGVWAVGDRGAVMRWTDRWTAIDLGRDDDLSAVWAVDTEAGPQVWAVGDAGTIAHFDGDAWTLASSGTDQWLLGVWGTAPDDVWAVGAGGVIVHFDGARWQLHESGTDRWLLSVWGTAPDEVWAAGGVGDGDNVGTVLHYDGAAWMTVPTELDEAIAGIWGASRDDVWFAGSCGVMLHYAGAGAGL